MVYELSAHTTYCVVQIEEGNVNWSDILIKALGVSGPIGPEEECNGLYIPICYGNPLTRGDLVLKGAVDNREHFWEDRSITQPRVYLRFSLKNVGGGNDEYVTGVGYDLGGTRMSTGRAEELYSKALKDLKYITDTLGINPCSNNNNIPNTIQVPN